jgi:hypothetical protein
MVQMTLVNSKFCFILYTANCEGRLNSEYFHVHRSLEVNRRERFSVFLTSLKIRINEIYDIMSARSKEEEK